MLAVLSAFASVAALLGILATIVVGIVRSHNLRKKIEGDLRYFPIYAQETTFIETGTAFQTPGLKHAQKMLGFKYVTTAASLEGSPPLNLLFSHMSGKGRSLHSLTSVFLAIAIFSALFVLFNLVFWAIIYVTFQGAEFSNGIIFTVFLFSFIPLVAAGAIVLFLHFLWAHNFAAEEYRVIMRKFGKIVCDLTKDQENPSHLNDYD